MIEAVALRREHIRAIAITIRIGPAAIVLSLSDEEAARLEQQIHDARRMPLADIPNSK